MDEKKAKKELIRAVGSLSLTSMGIGIVTWELGKVICKTIKMTITGKLD